MCKSVVLFVGFVNQNQYI